MNWINGNGLMPGDGANAMTAAWFESGNATGPFPPGSPGTTGFAPFSADAVRPAWFGGGYDAPNTSAAGTGGGGTFFGSFASALQQLMGRFGYAFQGGATAGTPGGTRFRDVTLGSTGDPHLSVNGSEAGGGSTVDAHFDSMTSHADLFSTGDFGDGFNVATTVTAPNANGVTQNASATATIDGGYDAVTMNAGGSFSITSGGEPVAIAAGQTLTLAGGATVTESAGGALSIAEQAFGKRLVTTFTPNGGGGVDVTATGHDVSLTGDLISGAAPAGEQPNPSWRQRYAEV
jgi:hypothetical protein